MDWYQGFLLCVFLLWLGSTDRDRNSLRIVLIASLASEGIVDFITRQIYAPWKLAIPGAVEVLTILALFQWAKNRTGYLNIGLLCAAWFAHLMCYVDASQQDRTGFFYANYEAIIQAVAIGQLLVCHDTIRHIVGSVVELFRFPRNRIIRPASVSADILRSAGDSGLSDVP